MTGRDGVTPRYQKLAQTLGRRIEGGDYPVGSMLPTEQDLCAEFGVSRHTVREALRMLTGQRLLHRRQGSGTEVIATETQAGYQHSMRSLSELFEYASDTRLVLTKVELTQSDDALAALLGRRPGRRWLSAQGVRKSRGGQAIAFTRIFLHEDFAVLRDTLQEHTGPIYRLLEDRFGVRVEEVAQEIAAEHISGQASQALGLEDGNVAIRVTRRYLDASDQPLIVSFNWHPAASFSYRMRLRREEGTPKEGRPG